MTSSASVSANGSDVITNGSDVHDDDVTMDKCGAIAVSAAPVTVLEPAGTATTLSVLPVEAGTLEESPCPESPSSHESSSAAAPLSTASWHEDKHEAESDSKPEKDK